MKMADGLEAPSIRIPGSFTVEACINPTKFITHPMMDSGVRSALIFARR
jgi:hypothetical protein